ncbi:putative phage tail assembly chaperone [Pantoea sp. y20]
MSDKKNNTISLTAAGVDLVFAPNRTAYNGLINEMSMTNKIAPTVTYLGRIVQPESKEALNQLIENHPGIELQLADAVNKIYSPEIAITVKP